MNQRKLIFYFKDNPKPIVLTDESEKDILEECNALSKILENDNIVCKIHTPKDHMVTRSKDIKSILISDIDPEDKNLSEISENQNLELDDNNIKEKSKKSQKVIITSSKKKEK